MSQSKGTFSWEDEHDKNGSALDFEIDYFDNLRSWDFFKIGMKSVAVVKVGMGVVGGGGRKRVKHGDSSSNSGASAGKERHVTIPVTFTSRKQYKQCKGPLSFEGKGSDFFVCLKCMPQVIYPYCGELWLIQGTLNRRE
eukprot:469575_1